MRKIICDTTFLDGRDRFEAGEALATEGGQGCRVISAEQADRFVAEQWAHDSGMPLSADRGPGDESLLQVQHISQQTVVAHG